VAERRYLSHFKIYHDQKVVKEREIKFDSLSAFLKQLPTISDDMSSNEIQSIKNSFDDQIKLMKESLDGMTCALENFHMPNFLSHKLGTEIVAPNTSATNGFFQSQPYYSMSINWYPG
jgi:CRISPR/Cas system-associated protein Csx1